MTLAIAGNGTHRWTASLSWTWPDWATKSIWSEGALMHEAEPTSPINIEHSIKGCEGHWDLTLVLATADVLGFAEDGTARVERDPAEVFMQIGGQTVACLKLKDARQFGEALLALVRAGTQDTHSQEPKAA